MYSIMRNRLAKILHLILVLINKVNCFANIQIFTYMLIFIKVMININMLMINRNIVRTWKTINLCNIR